MKIREFKKVIISFDKDKHTLLRRYAFENDYSVNAVVRIAVNNLLHDKGIL